MTATVLTPKNEADWLQMRTLDVTSTESAALFDCSPYLTAFELYHRKKSGLVVGIEPSERMRWGSRLQDAIAAGIAEDNKWTIRRMNEYLRLEKLRAGASFDFAIGDDGLLEIKNVDSLAFRDGWIVDGDNIEAPPHIEIQVQHQLMVSGREYAYIGALVGGNRLVLVKRDRQEEIIAAIMNKIMAFWLDIERGKEPKPDFGRDAGFIAKLYSYAEPGKVMDAKDDESLAIACEGYRKCGEEKRAAEAAQEQFKAEILRKIGDHEKVLGKNYTLSAGLVAEAEISYTRKPYRAFKVTFKKEKP